MNYFMRYEIVKKEVRPAGEGQGSRPTFVLILQSKDTDSLAEDNHATSTLCVPEYEFYMYNVGDIVKLAVSNI